MPEVNAVANMWSCTMGTNTTCPIEATRDGFVSNPEHVQQLADRVIADDGIAKLRFAAENWRASANQEPFFLAVGFRKPHLAFRFPKPFLVRTTQYATL